MLEQHTDANETASSLPDNSELKQQLSGGANWFYWIAGLSVINSVVNFSEGNWNFAVGLGITQVLDAISIIALQEGMSNIVRGIFFVLGLIVAGIFFLFGVFANRAQTWAFVLGMTIYAVDGLIMLYAGDVLGILIHALALYFLFRGLSASRRLNKFGHI